MKYTDLLVVHSGLIGATPGHHHLSEPGIELLRQRADEPEELEDWLAAQNESSDSQSQCDQSPRQKVNKSSTLQSHCSSVSSASSDDSNSSDTSSTSQKRPDFGKRWSSGWRDLKTGIKHHGHGHSHSRSSSGAGWSEQQQRQQ